MPSVARQTTRRIMRGGLRRLRQLAADDAPTDTDTSPAAPARTFQRPDVTQPPWEPLATSPGAQCNICRWVGDRFDGPAHSESALCPGCGSIARDRFLHWCLTAKVPLHRGLRLIETSPRLGQAYRDAMSTWFFYRTSDFDERAHRGNLKLDLQAIDLPDDCLDVMLTAHVLEHVPDTDAALGELRRILVPGGHLVLQVPVLQGTTAPPAEPEFHGDNTPVFWRFGFDLTARLRDQGFDTTLLCTKRWQRRADGTESHDEAGSPEFDVTSMLEGVIPSDLEVVADDEESARLGFEPSYMFLTWVGTAP